MYQFYETADKAVKGLLIVVLVSFMLLFLLVSKLIAIEMIFVFQFTYCGLIMLKKLEGLMEPFKNLWICNFYNELYKVSNPLFCLQTLPSSISRSDSKVSMIFSESNHTLTVLHSLDISKASNFYDVIWVESTICAYEGHYFYDTIFWQHGGLHLSYRPWLNSSNYYKFFDY